MSKLKKRIVTEFKLNPTEKITIGREEQRDKIEKTLSSGKHQLYFFSGPPGVGKTTMAVELMDIYSSASRYINCMSSKVTEDNMLSCIYKEFIDYAPPKVNIATVAKDFSNIDGQISIILDEIDGSLSYGNLSMIDTLLDLCGLVKNLFIICICNTLDVAECVLGNVTTKNGLTTIYDTSAVSVVFPSYSTDDIIKIILSKLPANVDCNLGGLKLIVSKSKNDLRHSFELASKVLAYHKDGEQLFKPNRVADAITFETRESAVTGITQDQKGILLAILKLSSERGWAPVSYKEIFTELEKIVGFTRNVSDRLDMLQLLCERGFIARDTTTQKKIKTVQKKQITPSSTFTLNVASDIVKKFANEARLGNILK